MPLYNALVIRQCPPNNHRNSAFQDAGNLRKFFPQERVFNKKQTMRLNAKHLALVCTLLIPSAAKAASVPLQNATATYSQISFPVALESYGVSYAIDGVIDNRTGWAIARPDNTNPFGVTGPETAAFETVNDLDFSQGTVLTFTFFQNHSVSLFEPNPRHNLGKFRLSVTTDPRDAFADGLESGGDVTANWIVLDPISFSSLVDTTLTELADHSILASGPNPDTDTYTVVTQTSLTGITGFRLETLEDSSLPQGGPGRREENGNFVLSEFQVKAAPVPEGGSSITFLATICGLFAARKVPSRKK